MDVLYLDHAVELGGAEISLLDLLRTVDRGRLTPTLACPAGRLAERARALDVRVVDLALEKLKSRNPFASLARLRRGGQRLRALLGGRRFQVVHANTLRAAVYASQATRASGLPFVWHLRDYDVPAVVRAGLMRSCDLAIATSQFLARRHGRSSKIRIVPNGVDLAAVPTESQTAAFRQEFGIPGEAPVVGCLGRVRPWKGQREFVRVAARLAGDLPRAVFLIVGATLFPDPGRDYVAEVEGDAQRLGVADRVLFTGHREDPMTALGAMDVVVNCSENEPFGRVLIEAMACRRPVVAFRSGAVPEIVDDGNTGLLVGLGDTEAMAQVVLDLVRNPTRAEAYGEAGRQRVAAHFALASSTARIQALYDGLAADAP
ncbi:MAG: glycosyltransferase family 4 protein [Planctomycetota bacterium]